MTTVRAAPLRQDVCPGVVPDSRARSSTRSRNLCVSRATDSSPRSPRFHRGCRGRRGRRGRQPCAGRAWFLTWFLTWCSFGPTAVPPTRRLASRALNVSCNLSFGLGVGVGRCHDGEFRRVPALHVLVVCHVENVLLPSGSLVLFLGGRGRWGLERTPRLGCRRSTVIHAVQRCWIVARGRRPPTRWTR